MATIQLSDRLRVALIALEEREMGIQAAAGDLSGRVSDHAPTRDLFADIRRISGEHLIGIRERLRTAPAARVPRTGEALRDERSGFAEHQPIADSLCAMHSLLGNALIRYSAMQPVTNRLADSWVAASEGTTAHIARDHTQEYAAVMGRITDIVHDAVIWEMENDGMECRCICPSCGLGVCLCAVAARGILRAALADALPRVSEAGIEILRPRAGSSAESAGFVAGDNLVSIDNVAIDSILPLQGAIRDHETGTIEFSVLRDGEQVILACETT